MVVIDCNAAVAIALASDEGVALQIFLEGENEIIACELFKAEVANALSKYVRGGYITLEQAMEASETALKIVDSFHPIESLFKEAIAESVRLNHSVYDMFYFVLARRNAATLFTLDKKLQDICLANGVNCIYSIREKIFPTECEDTQCD